MKHFLILFLAGCASATGFAPLGLWPLTLAGLALLMAMTFNVRRMRVAFVSGWVFGLGHFGVSMNWIAQAFSFQSAIPTSLGWLGVFLLAAYAALFIALPAALAWRIGKGMPVVFILLFAAFWITFEYLSGIVGYHFQWNPLAAVTVAEMTGWQSTLPAITRLIGTYGLSGLLVLAAGAVFLAVARRFQAAAMMVAAPALALVISFFIYSGSDLSEAHYAERDNYQPTPLIRVIQPNIDQSEKWDPDFEARNFALLERYTGETGDEPRLVFWPEAAVPQYIENQAAARFQIAELLGPDDILLLGATRLNIGEGGNGRMRIDSAHNSIYAMDARAGILDRYDKTNLVPYGEYLPLRGLMDAVGMSRLAPGDIDFIPGVGATTMELPGFGSAGGQICYEIVFSGQVIDRYNRPDFIFNPSNDAWFGAWGPPQHLAQARLRAMEEAMPIIRSTPTGISAVIDARGQVLHSLPWRTAGTIDARLPRAGNPTVFSRYGNILPLGLALLLLIAGMLVRRRESRGG